MSELLRSGREQCLTVTLTHRRSDAPLLPRCIRDAPKAILAGTRYSYGRTALAHGSRRHDYLRSPARTIQTAAPGLTPEEIAEAHRKDVEVQGRYGVKYMTYWWD
jgi:hypothetical protein